MLVKPQIGFTYDCRRCETAVNGVVDLFPLMKRRTILRCRCGESALVACLRTGILVVEYPCGICGQRHRAAAPLREVLQSGATFCCPVTDSPACQAGRPGTSGMQPLDDLPGPPRCEKTPRASDVLCAAQALAAENRISCRCGAGRFRASYDSGRLQFTCATCGAAAQFILQTAADLEKIRRMRKLIL